MNRLLSILASMVMISVVGCTTGQKFGSTHAMETAEPKVMDLYTGDIPGSIATDDLEVVRDPSHPDTFIQRVTYPTMTVYLPARDKATGTAVVILPGGGYGGVSVVKEGYQVAERLNEQGVAAIVLKYRDPLDANMQDKKFGPLQDAQQALVQVRDNAQQWGVNPGKVGIMGFSAGGHLASSVAVHFDDPVLPHWQPGDVRPDFQVLIYPVISFDESIAHMGSRRNLLGDSPTEELIDYFSSELQVTKDTPPAFLAHSGDDGSVVVDNSLTYYKSLQDNGVSAAVVVMPTGGHGFGMRNPIDWFEVMIDWMGAEGF
ncbi:alpha/beta hydrolase [Gilvimarinus sp. SDUM040013]|uniref:Alpha/beta hydrolase n=1 Tax=Gilvimarinus gilvus TaxID=3058038 RepID=A0ABU4S1N8_9GAMM|nr:alpha/beta hydrolase [Gilvimarinus sp. SDUM040013]MDO3384397.1 alpha/beta hydrolase [Gilvimarinus sp. SDUM040013]MDX6851002.1 alpha/beta hydrolase [Gilvimarinus sp. SDUM040013]